MEDYGMEAPNILWFREIRIKDIPSVGGKGASLGEMANHNFPVPPGFVVTAQAYFRYLKETGIKDRVVSKIDAIDVENTEQLARESEEIRKLILATPMSTELANEIKRAYGKLGERKIAWLTSSEVEFVAVRSSATAEDLPSISEQEHVLIKVNGKPVYDTIGEVYKKVANGKKFRIEVPGMKGNKVEWLKVKSLYKHKANHDTLFKITTKTGRQIVVSPNHSLIALDEDKLEPKTVNISEVNKGTKLPVTAFIPEINCEKTINFFDYVKGTDVVLEDNTLMIKNKSSNWKIQNSLPEKTKVTEQFAYFLGLYEAEGSTYKNNQISITNSNHKLLEKVRDVLKSLGINSQTKINKHSLRFYCPALVRFLHETCGKPVANKKGKGKLCSVKRIPDFVFGWDKKNIAAFLRGCFDGDGTISQEQVSYCSTSKMLTGGMLKLLEILELEFYIRKKKKAFEISIPRHENEKFAKIVGFEDKNKKNRLGKAIEAYAIREKHPEFKYGLNVSEKMGEKIIKKVKENFPKKEVEIALCKNCGKKAEQTSYYKNKKRFHCGNCGKTSYEKDLQLTKTKKYVYFDKKGQFKPGTKPWNYGHMQGKHSLNELKRKSKGYGLEKFFSILDGTVKWDEVKEIVPVEYDDWVYDFEVPGQENFAAGLGGIITHNTASFAGQQETFLNVKGRESLVKAVQRCWASLFTARAVYYRKKNNFSTEEVGIAVVVQKMVESQTSGVMFTAEPTGDETKIVIEAGFGLGEAIVSGSVTPDTYTVDKGSFKILEKKIHEQAFRIVKKGKENVREKMSAAIARKQKIDDKTIVQLAKLGKQIERHYKSPQDVEWAIENKELFIVQSRPITTLGLKEKGASSEERKKKLEALKDKVILDGLAASPGIAAGKVKVVRNVAQIKKVEKGDILVTPMTSPDWVPTMKKCKAIITNEGGVTCHAAIVSRELGIPCVVGTEKATEILEDGDEVTVNGYDGFVYKGLVEVEKPVEEKMEIIKTADVDEIEEILEKEVTEEGKKEEETVEVVESKQEEFEKRVEEERQEITEKAKEEAEDIVEDYSDVKAEEMPEEELRQEEEKVVDLLRKIAPKVKVNVALPEAAEPASKTGADGIGLLRAEHMITSSGKHPAEFIRQGKEDELTEVVRKGVERVASLFKKKPVWYRTFDARSDEFRELEGGEKEPNENNPMIGWHGIRRDLDQPKMLKAQFKAIKELHEKGFDNVGVMLAFVQSAEEVRKAKAIAEETGLQPGKSTQFGVMIETPAAVWGIDEILKEGIDFISFGTNDLTQLTLGIDRNNGKIQGLFTELHPAILRSIKHVIKKCRKAGVVTSICGQAGSNPEMVKHLVRFGIDSISANIDSVEKVRDTVLLEEKKLILGKASKE